MEQGYIKLWRKMRSWDWYHDNQTLACFVKLLMMANWEDKSWQGMTIKRGSFVSSRKHLSETLGISVQALRTLETKLKSTNELTIKSTSQYTIYTIVNYELYQDKDIKTTSQTTSQTTNKQQTNNKRSTTTKEVKEVKKHLSVGFEKFWSVYPRHERKKNAFKIFQKINPTEELLARMLYVIEYKKTTEDWKKERGRFIPHPSTWLNEERWEDETPSSFSSPSLPENLVLTPSGGWTNV